MRAVAPFVMVLRTIVHHQQDVRVGNCIRQEIQQRLGFAINPVQILEHHDERLIEALTQ